VQKFDDTCHSCGILWIIIRKKKTTAIFILFIQNGSFVIRMDICIRFLDDYFNYLIDIL